MRDREFLTEADMASIQNGLEAVAFSLPNAFVIPELKNQDFYKQYRFGVAIAAVRGEQGDDKDGVLYKKNPKFKPESTWNEDQIVISYDPNVGQVIDKALAKLHLHGKKEVATSTSDELSDTMKVSPIKSFRGYE
jgi:hypothetical protein